MKNLLVPTDFSANAKSAVDYAINFAERSGATVHLVHVIEPLEPGTGTRKESIDEYNLRLINDANRKLDTLKSEMINGRKVTVLNQVYEGSSVKAGILQAADDCEADLVVMGTHGKSGLRRKLFGSRVAEIINDCKIPVLSIPGQFKWSGVYNIVLAIDQEQDPDVLQPVFAVADLFNANLSVVVFSEEDSRAEEVITHAQTVVKVQHNLTRAYPRRLFEVIHLVGEDFHDEMLSHITENNVQMLAMLTTKRDAIDNILNSSFTQQMSYHCIVPLLSLHSKK